MQTKPQFLNIFIHVWVGQVENGTTDKQCIEVIFVNVFQVSFKQWNTVTVRVKGGFVCNIFTKMNLEKLCQSGFILPSMVSKILNSIFAMYNVFL